VLIHGQWIVPKKQAEPSRNRPSEMMNTASADPNSFYSQLLRELYGDSGPWTSVWKPDWPYHPDHDYPHSNLRVDVVISVLQHVQPDKGKDLFWLECGSFIGNSAITTVQVARDQGRKISFIANDPFSGDVNMWAWNKGLTGPSKFNFLHMQDDDRHPRIYETFLSNIQEKGFDFDVLPIRAPSMVGLRLMKRLRSENRLSAMPRVIYLDSAHEVDETLMELHTAFDVLELGGILLGDDWMWGSVKDDVTRFAQQARLPRLDSNAVSSFGAGAEQPVDGVVLIHGQWIVPKAAL